MFDLKKLIRTFQIIVSKILSGYLLLQTMPNPVFAGSQTVATTTMEMGTVENRYPMRGTVTRDGFCASQRVSCVDFQRREIPGCYRKEEIVG